MCLAMLSTTSCPVNFSYEYLSVASVGVDKDLWLPNVNECSPSDDVVSIGEGWGSRRGVGVGL